MRLLFETSWNDLGVLMHSKTFKTQTITKWRHVPVLFQPKVSQNIFWEIQIFIFFVVVSYGLSVKKFLKDFVNVGYEKILKFSISQKIFWDTLGWNKTGACLHLVIFLSFQSFGVLWNTQIVPTSFKKRSHGKSQILKENLWE